MAGVGLTRVLVLTSVLQLANSACFLATQCDCSQNVEGLAFLDCSKRELTSMPAVRVINAVYGIDLSYNQISSVPSAWFSRYFSSIRVVTFLDNPLTSIANDAFANSSISQLSISYSAVASSGGAPPVFNMSALATLWPSLTNLSVSGFAISNLQAGSLGNAPNLLSLTLSNNQIATVSSSAFAALRSLNSLDLSSNKLSAVPTSAVSQLLSLDSLVLSNNQIWTVPANCVPIANLTYLDLSWNLIQSIQANAFLPNVATLAYLDVTKNQLSDATVPGLSGFSALQKLKISQNQLVSIDNLLSQCCQLSPLWYLDVSQNKIAQLTASSFANVASSLSNLAIDGNAALLNIDPATFVALQNLTSLHANSLRWSDVLQNSPTLFSAASNLSSTLKSLFMEDSTISTSQLSTLSSLTQLHVLSLQYNVIESIPALFFQKFSQLTRLSLNTNLQLKAVEPVALYGLQSLRVLDLSYTGISSLSSCVTRWLPSLQTLDLVGVSLNCDCNLLWLKQWAQAQAQSTGNSLVGSDYMCATPSQSASQSVISAASAAFTCVNASNPSPCSDIDAALLSNATFSISVQTAQTQDGANVTVTVASFSPYESQISYAVVTIQLSGSASASNSSLLPSNGASVSFVLQQSGTYKVCVVPITALGTAVLIDTNCASSAVTLPDKVASASLAVLVAVPVVCGLAVIALAVLVAVCCVRKRRAARRAKGDPFSQTVSGGELARFGESGTRFVRKTPDANANSNSNRPLLQTAVSGGNGPIYENAMPRNVRASSVLSDGRALSLSSLLDDGKSALLRSRDGVARSTTTIDTHETVPLPRRPRYAVPSVRASQDRETTYEELPDDPTYANARISRRESNKSRGVTPYLPSQRFSPSPDSQTVPAEADELLLEQQQEEHRRRTHIGVDLSVNATASLSQPTSSAAANSDKA